MRFRFWLVIFLILFLSGYLFEISNLIVLFPVTARFGMLFSVLMFLPFWICSGRKFSKFEWKDFVALLVRLIGYFMVVQHS